ncbi:MAG: hypothetical protein ACLFM7_00095 [Bacteroidales bacterium]
MKRLSIVLSFIMIVSTAFGQQIGNKAEKEDNSRELQYFRQPGYDGLNVFETSKETGVEYEGIEVRVGGDFALQYQGLGHSNAEGSPQLVELGSNVNLPTANLNLDVQIQRGMRLHLRTYLSSRHHNDTWVKGGYVQVDRLDFIKEGFGSGIMDLATFRAGVDELNYGDAHFRRSDNARALYNPFVGNYIMDAFTTEPFLEVNLQPADLIVVGGISNGLLNPTVNKAITQWGTGAYLGTAEWKPTLYGKLGFDKQVNNNLRVRLTGSLYNAPGADNGNHLYGGDRAGARYYDVFSSIAEDSSSVSSDFTSGRFDPGFNEETAFQINPFIKYGGLEFFGVFERTMGNNGAENQEDGKYTQIGAELLYRFGSWEQFYLGGRYNSVSGHGDYAEGESKPDTKTVDRINIGGGWFMTKNVLVKLEYVSQQYGENFRGTGGNPNAPIAITDGEFSGAVLEAVITF